MKKSKVFLTLLLIVTMLLSTAGCSKNTNTAGTKKDDSAKKTEDKTIKKPEYKIDNKAVKILTWNDPKAEGDVRVNQMAKDNYGIDVQYVSCTYEDAEQKMATLVMSGDSPDMITLPGPRLSTMAKGLLDPVDDYVKLDDPFWKSAKPINDQFAFKGKHYLVSTGDSPWWYIYYNKKIFEENGLETPRDLFKKGQWDANKLLEYAKKLTVDKNNDGNIDQYGLSGNMNVPILLSTGKDIISINSDGTVSNNLKDPDIAKTMNLYGEFYKQKLVDTNDQDALVRFKEGKIAMLFAGVWDGDPLIKTGDFSYVLFPKNPYVNDYYVYSNSDFFAVPKGAKNPAGAMAYASSRRWEGLDETAIKKGKQNLKDTYGFSEDDITHRYENEKMKRIVQVNNTITDVEASFWEMTGAVAQKQTPWETLAEQYYPKVQSQIDAVLNAK